MSTPLVFSAYSFAALFLIQQIEQDSLQDRHKKVSVSSNYNYIKVNSVSCNRKQFMLIILSTVTYNRFLEKLISTHESKYFSSRLSLLKLEFRYIGQIGNRHSKYLFCLSLVPMQIC